MYDHESNYDDGADNAAIADDIIIVILLIVIK